MDADLIAVDVSRDAEVFRSGALGGADALRFGGPAWRG
jgi:hypothetical protein